MAALIETAREVMRKHLRKNSLLAAKAILEHYEAKPSISATITGPVVLTWNSTSPSPTPLALSSGNGMKRGESNGHGAVASSATDALENL